MEFKLHYLPGFITGWLVLTLIISYYVAVITENVHPILPYISDLGIFKPSNYIFTQMMNIGALLVATGVYIRYRQIDFVIKTKTVKLRRKLNEIGCYFGFGCALGISLVANFPGDFTSYSFVIAFHLIGAFLAFGIGGIYLSIQTKVTFDLQPYYDRYPQFAVSKSVQYLRLFMTICFGISHVLAAIYFFLFLRVRNVNLKICNPDSPGYTYHLISAIAEWVLAIILFSYTLTATNEFKSMSFKEMRFESYISTNKKK